MNKRDICIFGIAGLIIIILNVLMMTVFCGDASISANVFVIVITIFLLYLVIVNGPKVKKNEIRPERYGIWGLVASTLMWFINRVDSTIVPDSVNFVFAGLFVFVGSVLLIVAWNRFNKNHKQ